MVKRDKRLRVFSSESLPVVFHVRNILAAENIDSEVRNQNLSSLMGEVPFSEIWPELWILDARDLDAARQHVEVFLKTPPETGPDWQCSGCGTDNEVQFAICWQCGRAADDDSDD